MRLVKRILLALLVVVLVAAIGGFVFVTIQTRAFDASMDKVYDVPVVHVTRSTDPAILERGKHLTESLGGCTGKNCHGADLAGGMPLEMGPLATVTGPNITPNGMLAVYKDGDLFRLLRHGIKMDGRSVRFMPVQDMAWLSDADLIAIVSYLRTVPGIDKPNGPVVMKTLGKIIDRKNGVVLDVARRIPQDHPDLAPPPSEDAAYGKYEARLCTGCHGEHLSGGQIPGTPASFAIPLNLTPGATGLEGWTFDDFDKLLTTGVRKNGRHIDPLMPTESFGRMNATEKKALYAYLMDLPPLPFGGR
jgi:hypothetical protein